MENLLVLGVLAFSLTAAPGQARECESDVPQAEAVLAKVKHMIEIKDVAKIEVFSIPYHMESPIGVYPELIEQPHRLHPKMPELTEEFLNSLALVVGKTTVKAGEFLPDLKWSVKIYDNRGEVAAIRIDGKHPRDEHRYGLVNDICVALDTNLSDWLEANFKPFKNCFEKAESRSELQKCFSR